MIQECKKKDGSSHGLLPINGFPIIADDSIFLFR